MDRSGVGARRAAIVQKTSYRNLWPQTRFSKLAVQSCSYSGPNLVWDSVSPPTDRHIWQKSECWLLTGNDVKIGWFPTKSGWPLVFMKLFPTDKMLSVWELVGKNTFVLVQTPPKARKWQYYVILRNNYVSFGKLVKSQWRSDFSVVILWWRNIVLGKASWGK